MILHLPARSGHIENHQGVCTFFSLTPAPLQSTSNSVLDHFGDDHENPSRCSRQRVPTPMDEAGLLTIGFGSVIGCTSQDSESSNLSQDRLQLSFLETGFGLDTLGRMTPHRGSLV